MRRVIISPAQLRAINEANTTSDLIATTAAEVKPAVQTAMAKEPGKDVTVQITDAAPGTEKNKGFSPDVDSTSPQQMKNYGWMTFSSNNNGSVFEGTKRQVELGRLLEMRKNGKVFSKRQLNEMFMETQENAERLRREIGKCRLYDIFDTIEEVFPEELENAKNVVGSGADLPEFLCSLFSKEGVDSDREEEFLDMLGI